jgi:hypothetical protein
MPRRVHLRWADRAVFILEAWEHGNREYRAS